MKNYKIKDIGLRIMVSINVNDITLPRNKKRISKTTATKPMKAVMKLIR